jgi:hypothetical protein
MYKVWDEETEPVECECSQPEDAVLHWLDNEQNDPVREDLKANGATVFIENEHGVVHCRVYFELVARVGGVIG